MRDNEFDQTTLTRWVEGALAEQAKECTDLRGSTPGGRSQVRWDDRAFTLGAELAGKRWSRPDDALGLAVGRLRTSSDYRRDSADIGGYRASGYEDQAERFYRYKFNEAVDLTPDFQWIRRPGGDGNADDVTLWGLRAKISF